MSGTWILLLLTFYYSDKNIISCYQCFIKIILRKSTGNTCAWEQRKLGEVGRARSGVGFPDTEQGGTSGTPFFKVSDMNNAGNENEMTVANNYVTEAQIAARRWSPIEELPAIFFAKVGAAVMLNRKRLCRFPFLLDNNTMAYSLSKEFWDADFAKALFETVDLTSLVQVGALPSYNAGDVEAMEVKLPKVSEQRLVGAYFRQLDILITLHQREESCAASFSASCFGTLKAFFWEQRKFSDFVLRESVFQASSSEYPSVEYEDVVAEEGRLNKDIRQKETQKTGIVFDGTQVLYGKLRPYLHNWLNPDFTGVAVGDWWVLRPVGADKKFLYRLIQTQQFDEVANQSSGSKMPRADWNLVSNTEFIIPSSLDEQRQIAGTFDDLDNLITLHQCKPKSRKGGSHVLYSYQV